MPERYETLTLVATDERGKHVARGSLAPLRRWSHAADAQEKEIAFALSSMAWTVDGAPLLTHAHVEKLYAHGAVEALNPQLQPGAALPALRALLDASRALGSDALARAIVDALRFRREMATGRTPTTNLDDVVDAFDPWLLVALPEARLSW